MASSAETVALIVKQDLVLEVRDNNPKSDKIILIKPLRQSLSMTIIQIYALLLMFKDKFKVFMQVSRRKLIAQKQDVLLIKSNWNAKVGNTAELNVVEFGLGVRNEENDL